MSDPKRIKPPPLKLGNFGAPPQADQGRPAFYAEESTMITALSDSDRKRLANGEQEKPKTPVAPPPPQVPLASLNSLNTPHEPANHEAALRASIPPQFDAQSLSENILTPVTPMFESSIPPTIQSEDSRGSIPISAQADYSEALSEPASFSEPQNANAPELLEQLNPSQQTETHQVVSNQNGVIGNGVIVVFNARGGVGASTLAVNLAGAAHNYGQRVALVDLDLQLGALASMLDGKPLERSLAELVMESSGSSSGGIHSAIDERAGLSIIAQEGRIGEIGMVTPDRLPRFIEAVRTQHDMVIIDGVRSFSDHAVTAMDIADTILVVVTQDVPALRSARKVISLAKRLGYGRGKVRLVLNRHHKKSALSVEEIESRLDYPIFEVLPNDFQFVSSIVEQGCLARDFNLKHPVTIGFDRLATQLLGLEPPPTPGFFSRFFK